MDRQANHLPLQDLPAALGLPVGLCRRLAASRLLGSIMVDCGDGLDGRKKRTWLTRRSSIGVVDVAGIAMQERNRQARLRLKREREREANARRTLTHQQSSRIVRASVFNAFEALQIQNMTGSASGTLEEPGTNVAAKSGLNREMLDCAHGMRLRYVVYKAERAGGWTVTVPPHHTSQDCSRCGARDKAGKDRIFRCGACGLELDRDVNASRNVLSRSRGVVAPCAPARKSRREACQGDARILN